MTPGNQAAWFSLFQICSLFFLRHRVCFPPPVLAEMSLPIERLPWTPVVWRQMGLSRRLQSEWFWRVFWRKRVVEEKVTGTFRWMALEKKKSLINVGDSSTERLSSFGSPGETHVMWGLVQHLLDESTADWRGNKCQLGHPLLKCLSESQVIAQGGSLRWAGLLFCFVHCCIILNT